MGAEVGGGARRPAMVRGAFGLLVALFVSAASAQIIENLGGGFPGGADPPVVEPKNDAGYTEAAQTIRAMGKGVAERLSKEVGRTADKVIAYAQENQDLQNAERKDDDEEMLAEEEQHLKETSDKVKSEENRADEAVQAADEAAKMPAEPTSNVNHEAVIELERLLEHARSLTADVDPLQ